MAELVDALVLGTSTFGVRVRVSPLVEFEGNSMAKIYHKEFKKKLEDKKKIIWTNEPKHENKFKKNLNEKRAFFKTTLLDYMENDIIKKCDRSFDICALKYGPKDSNHESTLVLQEYSNDESDLISTWEFLLYNRDSEDYDDSKFFTDSDKALAYFIDKTNKLINN